MEPWETCEVLEPDEIEAAVHEAPSVEPWKICEVLEPDEMEAAARGCQCREKQRRSAPSRLAVLLVHSI